MGSHTTGAIGVWATIIIAIIILHDDFHVVYYNVILRLMESMRTILSRSNDSEEYIK